MCRFNTVTGGPNAGDRTPVSEENQLTETQCREAIALMKHTTDEAIIKEKMKQTFSHRQAIVQDPVKVQDFLTSQDWYVALQLSFFKVKLK